MSILIACQCGKRFKAADQYAGKRVKCPGCGQPLTVPAAEPPPPVEIDLLSLAEPEVFQPAAVTAKVASPAKTGKKSAMAGIPPQSKRDRKSTGVTPSITISPGIIVMIILAILIPTLIFWAKEGPMKTEAEWTSIEAKAEDNIVGQISRALQFKYKAAGFDPMKDLTFQPKAINILFDTRGFMITMPDSISIQGRTTEGNFHGQFHPKTWRFELDCPSRFSSKDLHITGSASESDTSLDIDGTAVKD